MFNLRRLEHLIALAEERHFARAAARVHLSQPAFSRSIQTLEREAGLPLFDRDLPDVRPTAAGQFLVDRARTLLFDTRTLERDLALYRGSELGNVAFGAGAFPAAMVLPRLLSHLRLAYPGVAVRAEVSNWQSLLQQLLAEDIEFFVADVSEMESRADLSIHPLASLTGGFFVRGGHPLTGQRCTLAQAWAHGVAATRLPDALLAALADVLGLPAGQLPKLALQCDDVSQLRTVALQTDAVLGALGAAFQADLDSGTLVPLEVVDLPVLRAQMGLVVLSRRTPSPAAQRAIESVLAMFPAGVRSGAA